MASSVVALGVAAFLASSLSMSAPAAAQAEAESAVSALAKPQKPLDELPTSFQPELHGEGGLRTATARLLGTDASTRYWVALDRSSNVCVIAINLSAPEFTASGCIRPNELPERAAELRVTGQTWNLEAYLLPDEMEITGGDLWNPVSPNLITVSPGLDVASLHVKGKADGLRGGREIVIDRSTWQ
jgi:hypothetical protein